MERATPAETTPGRRSALARRGLLVTACTLAAVLALLSPPALAQSGDFTEPATSPEAAGDQPNSVAIGDFNGDGADDLAVANANSDNVTILLGDGSGDFTEATTSPEAAGNTPDSVAIGDFNGDGIDDLAVANTNSDDVTILLGDGNGDFTEATTSPEAAGSNPVSVAIGDFNGDGIGDLAVTNGFGDNVTILLGRSEADLSLTKTGPEESGPGETITYIIEVANPSGGGDAQGVVVSDTLPEHTTFVAADGAEVYDCDGSVAGEVTCTRDAPLAAGTTDIVTLTVEVNGDVTGETVLTNTAAVTAATDDPNEANNTDSVQTTVVVADPGLVVQIDDTVVGDGTRFHVTGTLTCPAGEVFRLGVVVTQGDARGRGRIRGSCTGEPQAFTVSVAKGPGPAFTDGPAEACATLQSAESGARTVNDETEGCEEVTSSVQ